MLAAIVALDTNPGGVVVGRGLVRDDGGEGDCDGEAGTSDRDEGTAAAASTPPLPLDDELRVVALGAGTKFMSSSAIDADEEVG